MFDLSVYAWALLAHVTAGSVLIGSSMVAVPVRRAAVGASSLDPLRMWLDFGRRSARANPIAAFVLLATGIYLGSSGWWTEPWFYVAAATWVINSSLAVLIVNPTAGTLGAAAARATGPEIPPDVAVLLRSTAWPIAEAIMRANDLVMLYVMFNKPSLAESCLVVAGTAAVFVAVEEVRRRRLRGVASEFAAA